MLSLQGESERAPLPPLIRNGSGWSVQVTVGQQRLPDRGKFMRNTRKNPAQPSRSWHGVVARVNGDQAEDAWQSKPPAFAEE
jgi:hypothetical protein